MATIPSLISLLALLFLALLVIPSSAFVPTFSTTSHALRLRSVRCNSPQLRVAVRPLLQMSGGRNDNPANPNNDEYEYESAISRRIDLR